jgi:hypothetical protein
MADLFTRLASRAHAAGREHTGVVPRLPARFEHTTRADDGLTAHDVETPAPAAPVRAEIGESTPGAAVPPTSPPHREPASAPRPTAAPAGSERVVHERSAVERVVHRTVTSGPAPVRPDAPPAPAAAAEIGTTVIRPVTVVRHADDRPRAAVADRPRSQSPVQRQPDLPAVHISIGRIEVRATAASAPPPVAAPRPEPETGRSLAAYLRGDDGGPR